MKVSWREERNKEKTAESRERGNDVCGVCWGLLVCIFACRPTEDPEYNVETAFHLHLSTYPRFWIMYMPMLALVGLLCVP